MPQNYYLTETVVCLTLLVRTTDYITCCRVNAMLTKTVLTRRVSSYGLPAWVSSELGPIGGGTTFTTSAAALEPGHCGVVASTSAVSLYTHYMRHHTPSHGTVLL